MIKCMYPKLQHEKWKYFTKEEVGKHNSYMIYIIKDLLLSREAKHISDLYKVLKYNPK